MSSVGHGVYGAATSTTGINYGVYGTTASSQGCGIAGIATSTTGSNAGVYGSTSSGSGYAGYFEGGKNYFQGNVGIGTPFPGSPLTVDGVIESEVGGFKFPDGTIQTTDTLKVCVPCSRLSAPLF